MIGKKDHLIICLLMLFASTNSLLSQELFHSDEIQSINNYYFPLFPSDSIKKDIFKTKYINVCLFNGECSLCLNQMKEADNYFQQQGKKDLCAFFIVETSDTMMFNFHRDRLNIKTSILWDKSYKLREKRVTELNNTVFLIDNKGQIHFEGNIFTDKKSKKKYDKIVKTI